MVDFKRRRTYDREFKLEVLQMIEQDGRTIKSVAEDLGIHKSVISRWRREFHRDQQDAFVGIGHQTPQEEDIRRLRRKLADVTEERDILKKAVAFFAKHSE
jgi:transposase